jgi:superfamily II DNA or RNA helicase
MDDVRNVIEEACQRFHLNHAQKEALEKILGKFRGIVQMPTGSGKTKLAATYTWILHRLGYIKEGDVVLYFTPRQVIRIHALKEFSETLEDIQTKSPFMVLEVDLHSDKTKQIINKYYIRGSPGSESKLLDWLVRGFVTGLNKVCIYILTPQLYNDFIRHGVSPLPLDREFNHVKMIILDEVHHTYWGSEIANRMRNLLSLQSLVSVIGLTATPVKEAVDYVGEILYSLSSKKAMEMGILSPRLKIYTTETKTILYEPTPVMWGGYPSNEWSVAVEERAQRYAHEVVEKLWAEANQAGFHKVLKTLVVAANTLEADLLKKYLMEKLSEKVGGEAEQLVDVVHYHFGDTEVRRVISQFKKMNEGVLVTVNMADIGFDDPNLEALVIARPVGSPTAYVHIRGRVLRKPKNENNFKSSRYALIIDLTGAAKHEQKVEKVETGKYILQYERLVQELDELEKVVESDKIVHGIVEIDRYEVIELHGGRYIVIGKEEYAELAKLRNREVCISISEHKVKRKMKCKVAELTEMLHQLIKEDGNIVEFEILCIPSFDPSLISLVERIINPNFPDWVTIRDNTTNGIVVRRKIRPARQ